VSRKGPRHLPAYVRLLPRHAVSRGLGVLGRAPLPSFVLRPLLWTYARAFGVDLDEAARPLGDYGSFLAFFTRELKPGLRPPPADPRAVASPADGRVHAAGPVEAGTIFQTKGVPYALADLIGCRETAAAFDGGTFAIVYLAPGDYHRFHWPFSATVRTLRQLPGDLWPVHPGAVADVPRLFARNERVVWNGELASGGAFAIAAVGALNVGSIRLAIHPLRTNRNGMARPRTLALEAVTVERGDEMGCFEFGSALVLLLAPGAGRLEPLAPGTSLRVGTEIGRVG
jgi:phosphatidylserine decarboxylase